MLPVFPQATERRRRKVHPTWLRGWQKKKKKKPGIKGVPSFTAVEESQRGTLHVVLTTGSDSALKVSPEAEYFMDHSSPAVLKFSATYEDAVPPNRDTTISSHPGEVATAVDAQIQYLAPSLLSAGTPLLRFGVNSPLNFPFRWSKVYKDIMQSAAVNRKGCWGLMRVGRGLYPDAQLGAIPGITNIGKWELQEDERNESYIRVSLFKRVVKITAK
jgi:hypothetical protein